jgi:membrane-associated phospholipid phosphatase
MGDYLGDGYYIVPAIGIIGIGGYLFKYPPLVRITIETLETMFLAGLASAVLKIGVGRARPNREDHDPSDFDPFNFFDEGFHSFPSGHALVGGSIAGVLAQEFDCVAVDILAYTLVAGLTAFHRIYNDKHWASDVFFGSALGATIGHSITRNRQERKQESPEVLLLPDFSYPDYSALRLTILF